MARDLLIIITDPECAFVDGAWQYRTWWNACSEDVIISGDYTVEPMLGETLAATNNRIEADVRTRMLTQGAVIDGRTHLFGGRSS
jgi:hypothetical protein